MQNTSHAVMAQRFERRDSLDDFPSPPWATRALLEYIIQPLGDAGHLSCLEPACGRGHMARTLAEYFGRVQASDVHPYGFGDVVDFTLGTPEVGQFGWVVTNPPFRLSEVFFHRAMSSARLGVAFLTRTVFVEGVGRHARMFAPHPPSKVAVFTERVPMVRGRLDGKASTATSYSWIIWQKTCAGPTELAWIPPCRKRLERADDYAASAGTEMESEGPVGRTLH